MPLFFGAVVVMLAINLAVEPNSSALALEPMGNVAGIAASVYGTIFFSIGASLGAVVSDMMIDGVYPLVLSFFTIGVIAIVLVFGDRRPLAKVPQ
jgi:DHA1 family bicyclomycin/chloramphenicol resistance-like MFS transporter